MWQAVQVMTKICAESERSLDYYGLFKQIMKRAPVPMSPLESLASSAVRTAHKVSPLPPFLPCPSFLPPSSLCPPVWSPWRPLLCALLTRSPPPLLSLSHPPSFPPPSRGPGPSAICSAQEVSLLYAPPSVPSSLPHSLFGVPALLSAVRTAHKISPFHIALPLALALALALPSWMSLASSAVHTDHKVRPLVLLTLEALTALLLLL